MFCPDKLTFKVKENSYEHTRTQYFSQEMPLRVNYRTSIRLLRHYSRFGMSTGLKVPKSNDNTAGMSTPTSRLCTLNIISHWKKSGFLGEMAYSRFSTGNYTMNWGHLVKSEIKNINNTTTDQSKGNDRQLLPKMKQSEHIKEWWL